MAVLLQFKALIPGVKAAICVWLWQTQTPTTMHGTTILSVRRGGTVVIAGDGQVTFGNTVMKSNARKVRRLGDGKVIAGFAGATAEQYRTALVNLKKLSDAGITIALGTDSGTTNRFPDYFEHRELKLMVDGGMTPGAGDHRGDGACAGRC